MNIDNIRKDFPLIEDYIYFDNACMTIKPYSVIEAMDEYYNSYPVCGGGRVPNVLTNKVDDKIRRGREAVKELINADSTEELVFTKNTTEGINLVSRGLNLEKGDVVLSTNKEHNSNLAPWIKLKEEIGIEYEQVPFKENGDLDLEVLKEKMNDDVKLISMVHTSNVDGTTIPASAVSDIAHDYDALFMLDGAQSVPHRPFDVKKENIDLLNFSIHKMLGPTGVGVLYASEEILESLTPLAVGGGSVVESTYKDIDLHEIPQKFECGLQNYSGLCGVEEAVNYLMNIGLENIDEHEEKLNKYVTERLKDKVNLIGPKDPKKRSGIFNFNIDGKSAEKVARHLEKNKIIVRFGRNCAYSWYNSQNIKEGVRASFYIYNSMKEAEKFVDVMEEII